MDAFGGGLADKALRLPNGGDLHRKFPGDERTVDTEAGAVTAKTVGAKRRVVRALGRIGFVGDDIHGASA